MSDKIKVEIVETSKTVYTFEVEKHKGVATYKEAFRPAAGSPLLIAISVSCFHLSR